MYKLIITSGCSFSVGEDTWVCDLERYYRAVNPSCEFQHLAVPSQGNELIQKKATRALLSALSRYRPEEIALFVMWSTHDRRGFYLPEYTRSQIVETNTVPRQFTDLSSTPVAGSGWYHAHGSTFGKNPVSDFYYSSIHSLELGVHTTLENMLTLNLLAGLHGIDTWQMMILTTVYEQILELSQSELCGHLYSAIDWRGFDLVGEHDYLRSLESQTGLFQPCQWHPNRRGHGLWFQQRLLPRITGSAG
jgi:hypothetical protein